MCVSGPGFLLMCRRIKTTQAGKQMDGAELESISSYIGGMTQSTGKSWGESYVDYLHNYNAKGLHS